MADLLANVGLVRSVPTRSHEDGEGNAGLHPRPGSARCCNTALAPSTLRNSSPRSTRLYGSQIVPSDRRRSSCASRRR